MPKIVRKMQKANAAAQAAFFTTKISPELLDQLVRGPLMAEATESMINFLRKSEL